MNDLQAIEHFCAFPNLGGYSILEYVPTDWVDQSTYDPLVDPSGNWLKAIQFTTGDWMKMPVLFQKRSWEQTSEQSTQGAPNSNQLTGIIQNLLPEVSAEFQKMTHRTFLVKQTDRDKKVWLHGTLESPVLFRYQQRSGSETSELKAYNIRFFNQQAHQSFGYAPIA